MRRVVIDTNVLVASLIQPAGPCGRLLDLVVDGAVDACVDGRILAEYTEVLHVESSICPLTRSR